jgi:hypothetical protein
MTGDAVMGYTVAGDTTSGDMAGGQQRSKNKTASCVVVKLTHFSKQCMTYSLTLTTTISPSSVNPSILGYAPPQAEVFFIHTLGPPLATLNGIRRLTTFVRKTFLLCF